MNMFDAAKYRYNRLCEVKKRLETKLAQRHPRGILRFYKFRNGFQYFIRENVEDKRGQFVKKIDLWRAAALAQYGYEQLVLEAVNKELSATIIRVNADGAGDSWPWDTVYDSLPEGKRVLIVPVELSDSEYLRLWREQEFEGKGFSEDTPNYFTNGNVRVRSKAEVIIGNLFEKYNIPFLYEKPVYAGGFLMYPDFTILDMRYRREIIWEHFGMMGDPSYSSTFVKKVRLYGEAGFFLGDNLLVSFESGDFPLDMRRLEADIRHFLCEDCA